MNYEQITAAAETFMSHPGFDKLDLLYRDGMREGFKDGARWAQKGIETQTELLESTKAAFKALLQQVETLKSDVDELQKQKKQAYPK